MAKEKEPTCFDHAMSGLVNDMRIEPEPSAWIRRVGIQGDYYGRGRVLRLPYQAYLVLVGYDPLQGQLDFNYAYYNNLIAIKRLEWACPYHGAVVLTDGPSPGVGKGTVTLVGE